MPSFDDDFDIEDLLDKLSPEELALLNEEVDPDDSTLPPSSRCKDQTTKDDTGSYNRRHLLQFLEVKAKEEKDWDTVPFEKKEPKKRWQPPPKEDTFVISDFFLAGDGMESNEFDDILAKATEEEMVDLSAVLGFHGILTQEQFQASVTNSEQTFGGFHAAAKAKVYPSFPEEPPNPVNVAESITQLSNNDASLKELNLNNIKNSSDYAGMESMAYKEFEDIFAAVEKNSNLETLSLASTGLTDRSATLLLNCLASGQCKLRSLNLESNFLTAAAIVKIIEAVNEHQSLRCLYLSNQRQRMGPRAEALITVAVEKNSSLIKLSLPLESPGPRMRITAQIKRNMDLIRQQRSKK